MIPMKNLTNYKILTYATFFLILNTTQAQQSKTSKTKTSKEANKRLDNYLKLSELGQSDKEIFEDLGNANFLAKNYESAIFWYDKLKEVSISNSLSANYQKRYQYAMNSTNGKRNTAKALIDWTESIKSDYIKKKNKDEYHEVVKTSKFLPLDFNQDSRQFMREALLSNANTETLERLEENQYDAPISLTKDGQTAYFSAPIALKPLQGVFSKKEVVHKIYKAEKINGQWKNIQELNLCPKYASAMHPSISEDGTRLYFASNMKGTFGNYDIYAADVKSNGSMGIAKNLGHKVNTKKNDLYPTITPKGALFFASNGRKGYGGLDVFMSEINQNRVTVAANLGKKINSQADEFAISLVRDKGFGYVMSNRGNQLNKIQKVAFSYAIPKKKLEREYDLLTSLNNKEQVNYTSTTFEDE